MKASSIRVLYTINGMPGGSVKTRSDGVEAEVYCPMGMLSGANAIG